METDKVLERIRGLINKAESLEADGSETSMNEAQACRERADEMMQKYAVEEWQTAKAAPVGLKPTRIKINLGDGDNPFLEEISTLVNIVARFCKCTSMWMRGSGWGMSTAQEYSWVYGYESDLRYFEMLFTTIHLHMIGAIFPKPDPNKTLGQNAFELHNAGLNWFDIAKAYGWYQVSPEKHEPANMYVNRHTGERKPWSKSVGPIKKAYAAEVASRDAIYVKIHPNGSMTYRRNAAQGYLARIGGRFRELQGQRGSGTELVLADKTQNIWAMVNEDFPNSTTTKTRKVTYNETAYTKGVQHANTAALNPEATARPRTALD
jgi:hypothetical protein